MRAAGDLNGGAPGKLFDDIKPNGIHQGALGDYWLLAHGSGRRSDRRGPGLLEEARVRFVQFLAEGRYSVRLYDIDKKQFSAVDVDSLIPCRGVFRVDVQLRRDGDVDRRGRLVGHITTDIELT